MNNLRWFENAVFYEVFPKAFYDAAGDGIGDLKGLTQKMPYIRSLGVDAVYMMPMSLGARNVLHRRARLLGYEVADPMQVDPEYGTEEDFRMMVAEARKLGLKIIVDYITFGLSQEHSYFQDLLADPDNSPYKDFFFLKDYDAESENWCHYREGRAWTPLSNGKYYYCLWGNIAYLNYSNPAVEDYMFRVAEYWLNLGVDGFRLDATKFIIANGPGVDLQEHQPGTLDYWRRFKSKIISKYGEDKILMAEILPASFTVDYVGKDREMMDFLYDGTFTEEIYGQTNVNYKELSSFYIDSFLRNEPNLHRLIYHSNHDYGRIATKINDRSDSVIKLLASLVHLSCGTPMIYFGEEIGLIGMVENDYFESLGSLTSMAWNSSANGGFTLSPNPAVPVSSDFTEHNVELQDKDPDSILNHYRKLIGFRKMYPVFAKGSRCKMKLTDPFLYHTLIFDEHSVLLVLHHLASVRKKWSIDLSVYGSDLKAGLIFSTAPLNHDFSSGFLTLEIPAFSSAVYQLQGIDPSILTEVKPDPLNSTPLEQNGIVHLKKNRTYTVDGLLTRALVPVEPGPSSVLNFYQIEHDTRKKIASIHISADEKLIPIHSQTTHLMTEGTFKITDFEWDSFMASKTRSYQKEPSNRNLQEFYYGKDHDCHYISLRFEKFIMDKNSGFDCVIFFHDPKADLAASALQFWLLPEIQFARPVSSMLVYQHQVQPPALYTQITPSLQPGTRRNQDILFGLSQNKIHFIIRKSSLPESSNECAVAVWSAGGNWGDIVHYPVPIAEKLPSDPPEINQERPSTIGNFIKL